MLRVAICDDEETVRRELAAYMRKIMEDGKGKIEILEFATGEELLQNYPENLDILLLDIQMTDMDGMATAREIRCFDQQVHIVFVTNLAQYALEGYKVRAFGYLVKPVSYQDFSIELRELMKKMLSAREKCIVVKNGPEQVHLSVEEIIFAETMGRKVVIHTVCQDYESTMPMFALEEELSAYGFVRCHTAFLVNVNHIKKISKNTLILSSDTIIPISKHRRSRCVREIGHFWGEGL